METKKICGVCGETRQLQKISTERYSPISNWKCRKCKNKFSLQMTIEEIEEEKKKMEIVRKLYDSFEKDIKENTKGE